VIDDARLNKVPAVTLAFWIAKIAATTLGETGGDAVSMSMNFGYLAATGIFAVIFVVCRPQKFCDSHAARAMKLYSW